MHRGGTHVIFKVHAWLELWNIQGNLGKCCEVRLRKRATEDPSGSSKIDKDADY